MPKMDRHGRWHDDRGRFMKASSAFAALGHVVDAVGGSGDSSGRRGSLAKAGARLAATEPRRKRNR